MHVNSISSNEVQSFGQKKEYMAPDGLAVERKMLERLANADNRQLQGLALKEASVAAHEKAHERAHRAIWYSLPVVAGLAAVAGNPAKASAKAMFSPRMKNLGTFAGVTAGVAFGLALINAAFAGVQKLGSSFDATRKFEKNHPFLSVAGMIGAAYGIFSLAEAGISKLIERTSEHIKPSMLDKAMKKAAVLDKKLVNNGVLNSVSNLISKTPASVKGAAKRFAPFVIPGMVLFDLVQMLGYSANKNSIAYKKYDEFKDARENAREILGNLELVEKPVKIKNFKNIDVEEAHIETEKAPSSEETEVEE